jgi:hypothetical protein
MSFPHILLVSGIPASGKSWYCRWLKDKKGWCHCEGDQVFKNQSVESAVQEAQGKTQPTVVDWGFPLSCASKVGWMKAQGVEIWWFDGCREAARESFILRNEHLSAPIPIECFEKQMAAITANWSEIVNLFSPRIIRSVKDGPQYLSLERIFQNMFDSR